MDSDHVWRDRDRCYALRVSEPDAAWWRLEAGSHGAAADAADVVVGAAAIAASRGRR